MKLKFLILVLCIPFIGHAQKELVIKYFVRNGEVGSKLKNEVILVSNTLNSLYTETLTYGMRTINGGVNNVEEIINQVYKDFESNEMWVLEDQKLVVKESMNLFNWQFESEDEEILNYSCKKAVCEFRGRKYIAWYTTQLPFRVAPWKVHGLPGIVLKLEVDNFYSLEAVNLEIRNSKNSINNPLVKKKIFTWAEYMTAYKKDIEIKEEYMKAQSLQSGNNLEYSYPKIEIIIEKNKGTFDEMAKRLGLIE